MSQGSKTDQMRWHEGKSEHALIRKEHYAKLADRWGAKRITLEGCHFVDLDAATSHWSESTFDDCTFDDSNFLNAHFSDCRFRKCTFIDCDLTRAQFDGKCEFDGCKFEGGSLSGARLNVPDPRSLVIHKTILSKRCITGHPFFEQFSPAYCLDKICGNSRQALNVYLARQSGDQRKVAIKVYDQQDLGAPSSHAWNRLRREMQILKAVDSPYAPRLLGSDLHAPKPYLVMERCEGLPLDEWIRNCERFREPHRRPLFHHTLTAIDHLQNLPGGPVLNRDIKPEHVLVNRQETDLGVKLIDYGFAIQISGQSEASSVRAGTKLTMAPEVLSGGWDSIQPGRWDSIQSELFSVGVTLAWVITGQHPFGIRLSETERLDAIKRGPNLTGIESPYLDILKRCLEYNPSDRPANPRDVLALLA